MKEWQRTPVQLVQEYCQRQKRPKPVFQNDRAPAGSVCECGVYEKLGDENAKGS